MRPIHRGSSDRVLMPIVLGLFAVILLGLATWQARSPELNLPAPPRAEARLATPHPAPSSLPSTAPIQASPGAIYRCEQAGRVI